MIKKPEILSPAGDFEKLRAALRYGADAVYLAGKSFGMRSSSDNFELNELKAACEYTHALGKKLYLTVNTMPHVDEYPALRKFLIDVADFGIDAMIVADLGVIDTIHELLPNMQIHISTQASITSPAAAKAYARLGASRLVLARELTLPEIRAIRDALPPEVKLEAFVHGAMCVSYSGRCMLSNMLTGRDANRGMCAQPCRWNYTILEEKRLDLPIPVEQDEKGTYIMSSRDMCTIAIIPQLVAAGIDSFKIEGRVKSAYYTAVVTNSYRMALDAYCSDPESYVFNPAWITELESVSHRKYATGFYLNTPFENSQLCTESGYIREKAYLATAQTDAPSGELCRFKQKNKLICGEEVELISPGQTGRRFTLTELYDENGEPIESAPHPSMIFFTRLPFDIKEGDILRGAN